MLVSPEMVSRTVQVRVRPPLPASTGPSSDTSDTTSRERGGTAVVYIHFYAHCGTSNEDPPATCISIVTVCVVAPATALHVHCCPCKSSLTRGMVYSTTVWSVALANTVDDWSLHSIEDTGTLVVQLMVADWPTVRGCSTPDSVMISEGFQYTTNSILYNINLTYHYYQYLSQSVHRLDQV